tara:strand:- start:2918 stop:3103 length:186 start_codon:yes stop_codon:yes gene_type:complete
MANITIDGKEYDSDSFSETAKKQLANLQFTQSEINRLQAQLAIAKTAQAAYTNALKLEVEG